MVVTVIRYALRLATAASSLYLLFGFLGQFPGARRYPWINEIWTSLKPLGRTVAAQLPTTHNRIDFALLEVMLAVVIVYLLAETLLGRIEKTLKGKKPQWARVPAPPQPAQRQQPPAQPAPPKPASAPAAVPPAATGTVHVPDGARVYRSEVLVVLDLVNSTGLVTRFGNALLATMKERIERVVTPLCQKHAATFIKGTGDGYLVAFASMPQALAALRQIYASLEAMNEGLPDAAEIALRSSINIGEVIVERDADRTGGAVHKTFRLQSVGPDDLIEAEGGIKRAAFPVMNYVIASEEAQSGMHRVPGFECRFLGLCELKGFPGLHRVYHLQWAMEGVAPYIEVVPLAVPQVKP